MRNVLRGFGILLIALMILVPGANADLIISQYYDGATYAQLKFIELTNTGGSTIDLTSPQLYIHFWSNPDADPSDDIPTSTDALSGSIAAGETFVLGNVNYDSGTHGGPTYATIDQSSGAVYFEGDDVFTIGTELGTELANNATLDSRATSIGSDDPFGGTVLYGYVGVAYDQLYIAYTDAQTFGGTDDVFIMVWDEDPTDAAIINHPWRNGTVPTYKWHFFQDGGDNTKIWYNRNTDTQVANSTGDINDDVNGVYASDDSGGDNLSVTMINLSNLSNQDTVWVSVAAYGGDNNLYYLINEQTDNGNIETNEVIEIVVSDYNVGDYPWAERTNVIGTPGSTWAASDVSYVRSHDSQSAATTYSSGDWIAKTQNDVDTADSDSSAYLGTHRLGDSSTTASIPTMSWRIIGVPFDLAVAADGVPSALFGDDMAGTDYGNGGWILSRYNMDTHSYDRFLESAQDGGLPALIRPGLGYWFIQASGSGKTLDLDIADDLGEPLSDVTITTGLPDATATRRGLQMFANPFNQSFTVSSMTFDGGKTWANATNDLHADYLDLNANIYTWDGGDYVTTSYTTATLSAWEGFWLARATTSNGDGDVDVTFPTSGAGAGPMASLDDLDEVGDWNVRVEVVSADGEYVDRYNRFGVQAISREGYDAFDAYEMSRPVNDYVSLSFPHDDWGVNSSDYTFDLRRQPVRERKVWRARLDMVNVPNREFIMTWPEMNDLPEGYTVQVHSSLGTEGNGFLCDMFDTDHIMFSSDGSNFSSVDLYFVVVPDDGDAIETSVEELGNGLPDQFEIVSAYPNPFNAQLRARIALPQAGELRAEVFDLLGRRVATLTDGHHEAGLHDLRWHAADQASGVYFLRVQAAGEQLLQKVVLAR